MKFILLAAAAVLAVPAMAQDTAPAPANPSMQPPAATTPTTADPQQTMDPATNPPPATPMGDTAPGTMGQGQTMPAPSTAMPMASPGMSPNDPPPAPLAHYPICRKGQYDKCMQRGGK